jgi:hypothetical protein
MQEKALRTGAGTMSTASKMPLSPRARAWYHDLMEQLATVEERVPANIAKIRGTIGIYERIYDTSSAEMRKKLAAGEIEETDDICTWSQLITVLEMILSDRD